MSIIKSFEWPLYGLARELVGSYHSNFLLNVCH